MQPVNLVAAIAATTKSGVVPPHSKAASAATGANLSRNYGDMYLVVLSLTKYTIRAATGSRPPTIARVIDVLRT